MQLVSATSSQLYEDYMPYGNHPELPVFVGEMPLDVHAPGCYTSQAEMKRYNRRNEQLADAAAPAEARITSQNCPCARNSSFQE